MKKFISGWASCLSLLVYVIPITSVSATETVTYQYDALGRLITASKSGGPASGTQTTTGFDPAGNRSNQSTTAASGATPPPPPPPAPPPTNLPPVANADSVSVMCGAVTTKNLTANDTDPEGNLPLTILSFSLPPVSSVLVSIVSASTIEILGGGGSSTDLVTYTVSDSLGATSTGSLTITTTGSVQTCF